MYKSIATWKVAPDGPTLTYTTLSLAANAAPVAFTMGSPGVKRRIVRYPGADGGRDTGYTLQARRMVWELFVKADTETEFDTKRDAIYRLFKPYENGIRIQVDLAGLGPIYQLDAIVDGPVDFQQSQQLGYSALVRVPLYAPVPLWTSSTQAIATSTLGGIATTFTYSGNYEDFPIVEIVGQIQDPKVWVTLVTAYGSDTYTIDLTGVTIADGVTYTVDLRPGKKTVMDSQGFDQIDKMIDPTWPDFRMWPAPLKSGGTQTVNYSFASKNANARVRVKFYNRFLSH